MRRGNNWLKILVVVFMVLAFSGCTFIFQKGRRSDIEKIEELSRKLDELDQAKSVLEDRLSQEIRDNQVKLQRQDKGLVITFVADILFDSGKAELRSAAYPTLDKVAQVLRENVPDLNVGIEGHTDNVPITHSGWKSNWELSAQRALSVVHYLIDNKGISPTRLSALAYGEFHPVASNETKQGRQLNRRVEIVILPRVAKIKEGESGAGVPAGLK
jgi:chemotaxis protein MotB